MARLNKSVSIIMPVYNAEDYIEEAILSVVNQTYTDWELLIIDDCSNDRSAGISERYCTSDNRIKLFRNKIRSGAFASRNIGLANSKCEYIAFLDADDIWVKTKLEIQLNYMVENKSIFSYTGFFRFKFSYESPKLKRISIKTKASYYSILFNNFIVTSTVMLKFDGYNVIQFQDIYYDDFKLWLDLLKNGICAQGINIPLTYYRLTANSLSRNKIKSMYKVLTIFTSHLGFSKIIGFIYFIIWSLNTSFRYLFKY